MNRGVIIFFSIAIWSSVSRAAVPAASASATSSSANAYVLADGDLVFSAIRPGAVFVVFGKDLVLSAGEKQQTYSPYPNYSYWLTIAEDEPSQFKQIFPVGTSFTVTSRVIGHGDSRWYDISGSAYKVAKETTVNFHVKASTNGKEYIFSTSTISNTDWEVNNPDYPSPEACGHVKDWSPLYPSDTSEYSEYDPQIAIWLQPES